MTTVCLGYCRIVAHDRPEQLAFDISLAVNRDGGSEPGDGLVLLPRRVACRRGRRLLTHSERTLCFRDVSAIDLNLTFTLDGQRQLCLLQKPKTSDTERETKC